MMFKTFGTVVDDTIGNTNTCICVREQSSSVIIGMLRLILRLCCFPAALCTKDSSPSQDEWLRQFDVSLPGCTLKKQVDILALIKQVSHSRFLKNSVIYFLYLVIVLY